MYEAEEELIQALIQGDDQAYRYAVKTWHHSMVKLAAGYVGEKLADEVAQEAWVAVFRSLNKFQQRSSLKTWIFRIVANEAKSRLHREKRMLSLESLLQEDEDISGRFDAGGHWQIHPLDWKAESPEELLSNRELEDCIKLVMAALPDAQAATLILREQQGCSFEEICNILEISESNARVLLHRARNRLYLCIEHFRATGICKAPEQFDGDKNAKL